MVLTPAQEFVFYRTYSRWVEELGRRETWEETVNRYFNFFKSKFSDKVPTKVWTKCHSNVLNMEVMPSMRALWTAGPALEKNNITGYNCSALAFNNLQSVVELFYILMCGTGVGFSIESKYIDQMPIVQRFSNYSIGVHKVGDSREGWADSLKLALETWFNGQDLEFDYSLVRPRGAKLKTMGGRASGPEPLKKLHQFVRKIIIGNGTSGAQGRRLTSLEWLDIGNMIADTVVVGGVRRSSEISFSDLNDVSIRHAKDFPYPAYREMSNNTAVYNGKPDMLIFMREWTALAASGRGERGIFNLDAAKKSSSRRTPSDDFRTNPCQSSWATVLTPDGISTIGRIRLGDLIWSGKQWTKVSAKVQTGTKPVFAYKTRAGVFIGTENHRILSDGQKLEVSQAYGIDYSLGPVSEVSGLNPQDILDGLVIGDGTVHKASNNAVFLMIGEKDGDLNTDPQIGSLINYRRRGVGPYDWKVTTTVTAQELPLTYNRKVPDRYSRGSWKKMRGFLRGLYSANGSVIKKERIALKAASLDVIEAAQQMLSALGIASYYTVNKSRENVFDNGTYVMRESYDLNITWCRDRFQKLIGFIQKYKQADLDEACQKQGQARKKTYEIVEVQALGEHPVFDITVEANEHTYWTGGLLVSNCGEINLRTDTGQFCNLSEVIVKATDKFDDLVEKTKSAVWLGAMQACLTNFPYIRDSFKKICEEERLLGVSLTGQMDNPKLMSAEKLEVLKEYAIKTCRLACKALGINMSVAITTGKPSGTVSQLVNCSSGAHPRYAKYYIRRYRISSTDPLFLMMKDQGVKFVPENGQEDLPESEVMTWVVAFPEAAPKNCLTRHDISAIEQLEWYLKVKKNWCEHNQSITVYVKPNEWMNVGNWVYDHFDDISGVSFLPFNGGDYKNAPYEDLTEAQYNQMVKKSPKIDYSQLSKYEKEDNTEGAKTYACTGNTCSLV